MRSFLLVASVMTMANGFGNMATSFRTTSTTRLAMAAPTSLTLFSPCKINLFLRILRKRDDGFHDLASLFQAVGFGDTLTLDLLEEDATEDVFTCNMEGVPTDQTNLVLRALTLMREKTGKSVYFTADLQKECPAQAGLGGGSANAATAMFAANELMGQPATLDEVSLLFSDCVRQRAAAVVSFVRDGCMRLIILFVAIEYTHIIYRWSNGLPSWDPTLPSFCHEGLPTAQVVVKS
jgi:hypothetical protein